MDCHNPLTVPRPSGRGFFDKMRIPCGKCLPCLQRKRNEWTFRLNTELKHSSTAFFITLTYSDENIPLSESGHYTLFKRDLSAFMKRLRVTVARHIDNALNTPQNTKLRFFSVGEYGDQTHRPHYHLLLFNLPGFDHRPISYKRLTNLLDKTWGKGFVSIGKVEPASIHYVTGYSLVLQEYKDEFDDRQKPFNLMSQGIGRQYMTEQKKEFHKKGMASYMVHQGHKVQMPRYYKDRIFSESEKAEIAYKNGIIGYDKEQTEFIDLVSRGINPRTYADAVRDQALSRAKALKRKQRM